MDTVNSISSDLRMCLLEGNRKFEFLNHYRGVQFVCPGELKSILEDRAQFTVSCSPGAVLLDREKTAIVLSNGLLDPFVIRVASYDVVSGKLEARDMHYVSGIIGNRHEHRMEMDEALPVRVKLGGDDIEASLVDLSLSGAGLHLPLTGPGSELIEGVPLEVAILLPEGQVEAAAVIRRHRRKFDKHWVAVQFTGDSPGKLIILRYINRRLKEIRREVDLLFESFYQSKASSAP
jgi:hypothetical protein